jgi:hypothetical protein
MVGPPACYGWKLSFQFVHGEIMKPNFLRNNWEGDLAVCLFLTEITCYICISLPARLVGEFAL